MIARGRRKYWLVAAVVVAGAGGVGVGYWRQGSAPRISFEKTEIVLPKCRVGQHYPFSVSIRNDGRRPLRLKIAGGTCVCSDIRLEKEILSQGEGTRLLGSITAGRMSGSFSSSIAIVSNDPNHPLTEVMFRGDVEPYIAVSPAAVTLRPDMRVPFRGPLRVRNTDDKPVTFSVSVTGVTAEASVSRMTLGPQEASVIDFSCPADVVQYQEGLICLDTNHPVLPVVTVPISVVPVRGLEVHPASIHFGMVSRSELPSKRFTLLIKGALADSASISEVSLPGFLQFMYTNDNVTSGTKEVGFAFSEDCASGAPNGTITVRISLKDQPIREATISVPVGGIVQ